jgi:hypothetical protein
MSDSLVDVSAWPSSAGLLFGFACVGVGQVAVFLYYLLRRFAMNSKVNCFRNAF